MVSSRGLAIVDFMAMEALLEEFVTKILLLSFGTPGESWGAYGVKFVFAPPAF